MKDVQDFYPGNYKTSLKEIEVCGHVLFMFAKVQSVQENTAWLERRPQS